MDGGASQDSSSLGGMLPGQGPLSMRAAVPSVRAGCSSRVPFDRVALLLSVADHHQGMGKEQKLVMFKHSSRTLLKKVSS